MTMTMSVEQPLWRALTGYRLLALVYAVVVHIWTYGQLTHPVPGTVYLAFLACWTLGTWRRVTSASRCTTTFLFTDMGIALSGMMLSLYVDSAGLVEPTVPSIWVAAPVLAFAIRNGWRWGAAGSVLVSAANIVDHRSLSLSVLYDVMLVCVASIGIGYAVEVARASERTLARALQIEAATRERERLARDIHDSVLQVLAMVQRRGTSLGGEAAELGRMAGEQEVALRALVAEGVTEGIATGVAEGADAAGGVTSGGGPSPAARTGEGGEGIGTGIDSGTGTGTGREPDTGSGGEDECDLRTLLSPFAGARVSVAEPGAPVVLRAFAARELAAAVGAALDNVRQHAKGPAGEEAQAWILVEDDPDEVIVTVRDDGPGIPHGRLTDAEAEGRLGVAQSIRGRLRDLGGGAELVSPQGQGTEVELRVPRPALPVRGRSRGRERRTEDRA